jgi:hypothetical protein
MTKTLLLEIRLHSETAAWKQVCQKTYFQTKNTNLGKFGRDLQFKMLVYLMAFWFIIRAFCLLCGRLAYFMFFGNFFPFWYVVPWKIWQPCKSQKRLISCQVSPDYIQNILLHKSAHMTRRKLTITTALQRKNTSASLYVYRWPGFEPTVSCGSWKNQYMKYL